MSRAAIAALAMLAAIVFSEASAAAQTVVDATTAEFQPSADHNGTINGTPLVTSYLFEIFPVGSATPSHSVNLGKPTPGTDGLIRFLFTPLLTTPLVPGTTYQARVSAVGPGGTSASAFSNTFAVSGSVCTPSLSSSSTTFASGAATGTVSVTAGTGCAWTATSNASWLSITSGASGTGNGSVGFSATANTATTARTGTLTIAGQTFTVTQSGVPCTYSINPTSRTSPSAGESTSVAVTSLAGCSWTATSAASWISITSGATGSGNGSVAMTVAANTATTQRTGTVSIAGQTFTVTQNGAPCTFSINPTSRTSPAAGEATSVAVTSQAGCSWTATSAASWISVTSGATGSGNGTVAMSVAANTATTQRSGTVWIGGQTFTVTQDAAPCAYSINPTSKTSPAAGEATSVAVTSQAGCSWTATSAASWIAVTSGASGSGNGTVAMSVAANTGTTQRTATVSIAGQTFTVTQNAAPCTFSISPTSRTSPAAGESTSVAVTSQTGCSWTATSAASWIGITSGASGSGNGTVAMSVAANTATIQRTGTVSIAGQTFTVTQDAAPCTFSIDPTTRTSVAAGESTSVAVTAPTGCSWTATSVASWIGITAGATGTGNGTVSMSVAANTAMTQRTGMVSIAGQTFTVTQDAAPCSFAINPTSRTSVAGGESTSVAVTAQAGCAWTAASTASWISVTAGASGSGNGTVTMSVAANPAASVRTGTVTIAGQTFTVNQDAAPCSYAISPSGATAAATGDTATVNMSAPAGCAWTATSTASWISVTTGASGSGDGVVSLTIGQNTVTTSRTGTVAIGGQTFTVTQNAAPGCSYSVAPPVKAALSAGENTSVAVTAGVNCTWTAVSSTAWITVTSGASGTGNGSVGMSIAANTGTATRTGTVTIAGQSYSVTQSAPGSCAYSVFPLTKAAVAAGESTTVSVTAGANCAWTALSNATWITVTSAATSTGNGTVALTIATNPGMTQRIGAVSIAGYTYTVTQAASAGCTYTVSPLSKSAVAAGETTTASVTAATGCAWTAASGVSWITISSGASGSGDGTVTMVIAQNAAATQRIATVTIAGRTFTVTQVGTSACTFAISPTSKSSPAAGETTSLSVTTGSSCVWSAASAEPWIMVSSGSSGTGNGTVGLTIAANTTASQRTGTATIGGQTFTVTQAAASCTYTVTPSSLTVNATGSTSSFSIGTTAGCAWAASGMPSWITISTATQTGPGLLSYTIASYSGTITRSATLTIAGQSVVVTQNAPTAPPAPSNFRVVGASDR